MTKKQLNALDGTTQTIEFIKGLENEKHVWYISENVKRTSHEVLNGIRSFYVTLWNEHIMKIYTTDKTGTMK